MRNKFKKISWMNLLFSILLFLLVFYVNFYFVNRQISAETSRCALPYKNLLSFSSKIALFSLFGISTYLISKIGKRFLIKFILAYFVFVFTNYFILITRNLNNKDFFMLNIFSNDLLQIESFKFLSLLVLSNFLIYLILKKYSIYSHIEDLFLNFKNENFLLGLLVSVIFFKSKNILWIIGDQLPNLTKPETFLSYLGLTITNTVIITLLIALVISLLLKAFSHARNLRPSLSLVFISSLIFAIIFNYTLQFGVKTDTPLLEQYIFPGATSYQIFILLLLFLVIYIGSNRYLGSTLFISTIGIAISIANIIKEKMRSEPLLITDFLWIREIKMVVSFVDDRILLYIYLAIITPILLYFLIKRYVKVTPIIQHKGHQFFLLFILLALFTQIFTIFKNEKNGKVVEYVPIISRVNNAIDIEWMGFDTNASYKSLMYVWTKQLTKRIMEKPDQYTKAKLNEIAHKYKIEADNINKERINSIDNQTIIYILSESLADPRRLERINLSVNVLPNIETIKNSTTSGLMKSDGFGGGTANMEFQTLTGLPYYNFSAGVSTLYTEVVPKMKVFPSISDYFKSKNRFILHPSEASNYSRESIYTKLKFDNKIFSTGSKKTFINTENIGINMGDKSVYDNILYHLDNNKSQFFSVITMQNHAPWSVGSPAEVVATGEDFSPIENENITEYARLLTYTDSSTKEFLDNLSKIEKNVTVVFYGDHLPGLYPDSTFKNDSTQKYKTDYFIWSNHNSKQLNYPLVNSSDFIAELFEHTESKVSPYYALLTKILKEASVDKVNLDTQQAEIAEDLKLVQYDITLGENYLKDQHFFKIGE